MANIIRILHTADWHLGKRLGDYARLPEQKDVMNEIIATADAEQVDVVVVAGDLYDVPNPPAEATELLYQTLHRLTANSTRPVVVIAGNHDQADRIAAPDPIARINGIFMLGYPDSTVPTGAINPHIKVTKAAPGFFELQLKNKTTPIRLFTTPFANEQRLRTAIDPNNHQQQYNQILQQHWQALAHKYADSQGVNVLVAHLYFYATGSQPNEADETDGERTILAIGTAEAISTSALPPQIQYVATGHLHRPHLVNTPNPNQQVNYSGSPLAYSFSEAGQQKSTSVVSLQPGQLAQLQRHALHQGKPLIRKLFKSVAETLNWLQNNPQGLVEITIETEKYISAADNRAIMQAHPGIVGHIIPQLTGNANTKDGILPTADLSKSISELFADYFEKTKGQPPDQVIMQLFKEIEQANDE